MALFRYILVSFNVSSTRDPGITIRDLADLFLLIKFLKYGKGRASFSPLHRFNHPPVLVSSVGSTYRSNYHQHNKYYGKPEPRAFPGITFIAIFEFFSGFINVVQPINPNSSHNYPKQHAKGNWDAFTIQYRYLYFLNRQSEFIKEGKRVWQNSVQPAENRYSLKTLRSVRVAV